MEYSKLKFYRLRLEIIARINIAINTGIYCNKYLQNPGVKSQLKICHIWQNFLMRKTQLGRFEKLHRSDIRRILLQG